MFSLLEQIKINLRQYIVLEVATFKRFSDFPAIGDTEHIYNAELTNKYYLWNEYSKQYDMTDIESLSDEDKIRFTEPLENYKLNELIERARQDIIMARHYPSDYEQSDIDEDINTKYIGVLKDLVIYEYNLEGMEYQKQHIENGVSRSFVTKDAILGRIIPFCNIL